MKMAQSNRGLLLAVTLTAVAYSSIAQPAISSFNPSFGSVGSTVTITGMNFVPNTASNIVYFGGARALVVSANSTSIVATVPAGSTYAPLTVTTLGRSAYSIVPFVPTFNSSQSFSSGSFTGAGSFSVGDSPRGVVVADFDSDGKPDLAAANKGTNTVSILRNAGNGSNVGFSSKVDITVGTHPNNLAVGDIDGDGKLDLVVANLDSGNLTLLRNTSSPGSISFAPGLSLSAGANLWSVVVADLDADGRPDIVAANSGSGNLTIWRNTSATPDLIFVGVTNIPTIFSLPTEIAAADFDGDGKPDIALVALGTNAVGVFRNTTVGNAISLASPTIFGTGSGPDNLTIGDFDSDGKPDLAVVNGGVDSDSVSVFRNVANPGAIAFSPRVDFSAGRFPAFLAPADLDGNGKPDLAVLNSGASTLSLLRNTSSAGTVAFSAKVDLPALGSGCAIGDFDGDGRPDIVTTVQSSNSVTILRNSLPQPPVITLQPQSQTVSWSSNISLTLAAGGSSPLSYQWYFQGPSYPAPDSLADATNTSVTISNAQPFNSGSYFVIVSNAFGATTSQLAVVTVKGFIQSQVDAAATNATILIPAGKYSENVIIMKRVHLQGAGASTTIVDGGGNGSVFTISPGVSGTTISDLTITNGKNQGLNGGGGVVNLGLDLTIQDCLIVGNRASNGGGIYNSTDGFLAVYRSSISGNTAAVGGGAWNTANLNLYECTLNGNIAGTGGGLYSQNPFQILQGVGLSRCTVSGNSATNGNGGGIFNGQSAITELKSCTIASNVAVGASPTFGKGGGVFNDCQGTLRSENSIYAGNTATNGFGRDFQGYFYSLGHNLVQAGELLSSGCAGTGTTNANPTDLFGINPLLGPLGDNGGPTFTHALLPGSSAIDAGQSPDSTDQRGLPRTSDGNGDGIATADIGAFEYQNTTPGTTAFYDVLGIEDTPTTPILFSLWDIETPLSNLLVTVFSSTPNLVPNGNLILGGTAGNRSLTIVPATNQFGAANISVAVSDGQLATTNTFIVNFSSVNDAPTISSISDRVIGQNSNVTIPFQVGDVETPAGSLLLHAASSDTTLLPLAGIVFGGTNANRTVRITPASGHSGVVTVTCTVLDASSVSGSASFLLTVQAAPQITVQPVSRTTTNGASINFNVTAVGDDLTYKWLFNGTNLLAGATNSSLFLTNIGLADVGSYAALVSNLGGSVTSAPAALKITKLPFISTISNRVTVSGLATPLIPFTIGDFETPASNLLVSATSSDLLLVPTNNIVFGGGGSNRTVFVLPASGRSGAATIQITVKDTDDGTATSSFVLTVGTPLTISQQPDSSLVVTQGYDATFNVGASGYGALNYQWRFNGTAINGANSASFVLYNAQPNQAGDYSVVVGYTFGAVTSSVSTLTVPVPPSPIPGQFQELALYAGWNLISFQVGEAGFTIPEFRDALDRPNALVEIWAYSASNRLWKTFQTANANYPPNLQLDRLYPGNGYWVRMSQSAVLKLHGSIWTGRNTLVPGWNLIGFPGLSPDQTEALGLDSIFRDSLGRIPQVWAYDALGQQFKGYDSSAHPPITALTAVAPGIGYWVYSLDGIDLAPQPVIALPADTDVSPLQASETFSRFDPRFKGLNPDVYEGRAVNYAGTEDITGGVDLNGNGILDDPFTQETILFDEGVRALPLSIANNGTGLINWAIDSRVPWLTFDSTSGVVGTEVDSVNIFVDRTGLQPGIYSNAVFVVQAGNLVKYVKVIMKVPNVAGDYRGAATTARVNGKSISLGMVDLNLSMYVDAGDIYHTPTFRGVINRDKALLFPKDVFMNGVFYQGNNFSLTTSFEVGAGDRNAPPYTTFTHAPGQPYGDRDWNGNHVLDNQNPFPFPIRREVTLLGRRTSPDHLEGTYVEAISGLLPAPQRIYVEGTFALDRESLVPTRKSIFTAKSTNNPVVIGGSTASGYTNTLTVPSPINIQGVTVTVKLDFSTPSQLEVFLFSPSGQQVTLHRVGSDLSSVATYQITDYNGTVGQGNWRLAVKWPGSGDRGFFNSWELKLDGIVVYSVTGAIAVVEGNVTNAVQDASIILNGSNLIPQSHTPTNGSFAFTGLTENDYAIVVTKLGYQDTVRVFSISTANVDLGTIVLQPIVSQEPLLIVSPFVGYAPLYVSFKVVLPNSITTALGPPLSATFDFGDGSFQTYDPLPYTAVTHFYTNAGAFKPSVTVAGQFGSTNFTRDHIIVHASSPNVAALPSATAFVFGGGFVGSIASPNANVNDIELLRTGSTNGVVWQESKRDTAAFDTDRFPFTPPTTNFNASLADTDFFVQLGTPFYQISTEQADGLYRVYAQPVIGGKIVPDRYRIICTLGGAVFGTEPATVGDLMLQTGRVEE